MEEKESVCLSKMDTSTILNANISPESTVEEKNNVKVNKDSCIVEKDFTSEDKISDISINSPSNNSEEKINGKDCNVETNDSLISESSNTSHELSIGGIVTEKMIEEEAKLEEKAIEEEKKLMQKISEEEKHRLEEQCYKRLHLLLSRSSIYAKFMADKLKRDTIKEAKKELRVKRKAQNNLEYEQESSTKRKKESNDYSPQKKTTLTVVDAFRKENEKKEQISEKDILEINSNISDNAQNFSSGKPTLFTGGDMHPYQIVGYEWLKVLFENGVNGILADEMGLGKTIQTIAFVAHLVEMGVSGPFLISAPLSTLPNWYAEFKRFAPSIPVMIFHGDKKERKQLAKRINKKVKTENAFCCPVVITSYQVPIMEGNSLKKYEWKLLVVDEAHRIKNFRCRLITVLKSLNTTHRLLLTGTPLQNDLAELWSLLNFILPEVFDDLKVFESWFDISRLTEKHGTEEIVAKEQEKRIVSIIHEILTPFLLRRTKAEVNLKLPPKKEVIVHAPLSKIQKEYYTWTLNKTIVQQLKGPENDIFHVEVDINSKRGKRMASLNTFDQIYKELNDKTLKKTLVDDVEKENCSSIDVVQKEICSSIDVVQKENCSSIDVQKENCSSIDTKSKLLFQDIKLSTKNISMLLRKICLHPYLISYPIDNQLQYLMDENLVKSSGKFRVLDIMLPELKKRHHKILIFSQFVMLMQILEDYCQYRNYYYNKICGSMSLKQREEEMKDFRENKDSFLFLISTRAGGLGLNLATADTVIIFDSDWNPQSDLQAQDRCHRIGQNKPVVIYRLLVPNTIDERIFTRATAKRKLEKVIIKKGRFNTENSETKSDKLSVEELLELLQSCETNSFVETDEEAVLSPEELEKILDRSDMVE